MRVSQVGKRLNLSESRIYEMVEKGEIEHHRIGGAIRFTEENIADLMDETKKTRREPETTPRRKIPDSRPRLKFHR